DGAYVEHDDVAVVARRQPGGKAHRQEPILAACDAGENAESVAPLRPQVGQRLLDRPLLAVAQRGASEQAHVLSPIAHSNWIPAPASTRAPAPRASVIWLPSPQPLDCS